VTYLEQARLSKTTEPEASGMPMIDADSTQHGDRDGGGPCQNPAVRWAAQTGSAPTSPAVADGRLFTSTQDGLLLAIDSETGVERWRRPIGSSVSAAAVHDGVVLVSGGGHLHALDAWDGTEVWAAGTDSGADFSDSTVVDGVL